MQLSLHADYGCRVLIYLALTGDRKVSIKEISQAYGISENHLVKVVQRLGQFGFIETTRGRGGGICLARAPESIKVGDVVRRLEPGFQIVECFDPVANRCPIIGACGLTGVLNRALAEFLAHLDQFTVADVTREQAHLRGMLGVDLLEKES